MATAGMAVFGGSFVGLLILPVDFSYWAFALLIAANGIGGGMFGSPNSSSIMSSVPASQRGIAGGIRATFQNSGTAISITAFFSLMIAGLSATLPKALNSGLTHQGVPQAIARRVAELPPTSSLFASLLGVNPIQHLLAPSGALSKLSPANRHALTGSQFFPHLIAGPFHHGLVVVFVASAAMAVLAGVASALRGSRPLTIAQPAEPPPPARPRASGQAPGDPNRAR